MPTLSGQSRFAGDDGSADPAVSMALTAFAAGRGSEQAALTALAAARLLVPLVTLPAAADAGRPDGAGPDHGRPESGSRDGAAGQSGPDAGQKHGCDHGEEHAGHGREHAGHGAQAGWPGPEMAMPRLVGRDGRAAIPAFTSLDALMRWQRAARPVPAEPAVVWRTAVEESCAVVIDVAGPVPLAIEGARLAALAAGHTVPPPHEDPDIRDAVGAAVAEHAPGAGFALRPALADADVILDLALPPGLAGDQAAMAASRVGQAAMARLGGRLRRGIAVALS
ncbi:MAG: SseB family protein [Streptosporangiaceae bacterium]